jgi:hypothetical protein
LGRLIDDMADLRVIGFGLMCSGLSASMQEAF